jgi:hypothetical protein
MKRLALALGLVATLLAVSGCKKQAADNDAIRAAIMQHLTGIGTLNISSMDMDIRSVAINGNQAHAEVEFRPKTGGGAPGTGMQVSYNLEKRDGAWVVLKSQTGGGMMQHPTTNQNPHNSTDVHNGMPNFNDILNQSGTPPQGGALPPGHPPVGSQPANPPAAAPDQTSTKKPS